MDAAPDIQRPVEPLTARVVAWFVDRRESFELFTAMVAGQRDEVVLAVEGPEGIGKSWLLRNLRHYLADAEEGPHVPAALIDFKSSEFLDELAFWLTLKQILVGQSFPQFDAELESALELEVVHRLKTSGGKGGVVFEAPAEVYGEVAGRDIIKDLTFNTTVSRDLILVWARQLGDAFLADLADLGKSAILFDSYEHVPTAVAKWLRSRLLPALGEGRLPGVRVAIAGREVLDFPSSWEGLVDRRTLDGLPAEEVRRYLTEKRGLVIGDDVIQGILELSRGEPDKVAMFADHPEALPREADRDRLEEILMAGILEDASESERETWQIIAVPDWFDIPLMGALLPPEPSVDERWAAVSQLSIIEPLTIEPQIIEPSDEGPWQLAPGARQALLATWADQPARLRQTHEAAARHFEARAEKAPDPETEREMARQAIGHILTVDEQEGRTRVRNLFAQYEAAHLLTACDGLLRRAETVKGVTDLTRNWLDFLKGRLMLAQDKCDEAAEQLSKVREAVDPASELHLLAGIGLAECAAGQNEWSRAVELCEGIPEYYKASKEPKQAGRVLLLVGDAYREQAQALGGPIELAPAVSGTRGWLAAIPSMLVALPFVLYAYLVRHWRSLPPVHLGLSFRNWTFMRLLLSARACYHDAEATYQEVGLEERLLEVWHRLAQTNHLLGLWHDASERYDTLLRSPGATKGTYLRASVLAECAETELALGQRDAAVKHLAESSQLFAKYKDRGRKAEVDARLGEIQLASSDNRQREEGLTLLQQALGTLGKGRDQLAASRVAASLEDSLQAGSAPQEQAGAIEALVTAAPVRFYFSRVQDKTAAWLEMLVSVALVLAVLAGLFRLGLAFPLNLMTSIWQALLSPGFWGGMLWRFLVFAAGFTLVAGIAGFLLVLVSARREPKPESLDRIVTDGQAISRVGPRRGSDGKQESTRIPWTDVRAIVSAERCLWRAPIPLLSYIRVFGENGSITVPATMLRYEALKRDIEVHLTQAGTNPIRRARDLHILRSRLGLFFLLGPVFMALGSLVMWNLVDLPLSIDLAIVIGPGLLWLGTLGLVAGPYYWLVLYPLRMHYETAPRSRAPWLLGGLGLLLVAFALYMAAAQPYFPIRHWMDGTIHPLGFILLLSALLWIVIARDWAEEPVRRGRAVYPSWLRGAAGVLLAATLVLTGNYAVQAGAFTQTASIVVYLNHGDAQAAVDRCTDLLGAGKRIASLYNFRALAYMQMDQPNLAVQALTDLINGPGEKSAHYLWNRARAYHDAGQDAPACADTVAALSARRWQLSKERQLAACCAREDWTCLRVDKIDDDCAILTDETPCEETEE
jgi:tetratricopeptide (TPR) repeat protein